MSLLPLFLDYEDPFEIIERQFHPAGSFAVSLLPRDLHRLKQAQQQKRRYCPYIRKWSLDKPKDLKGETSSQKDQDQFQVSMDVEHFAPNEISVKTVDNTIVVEGKHEERQDDQGYISRHFLRRYQLPEEFNVEQVASALSSDGVLTITAPKISKAIEGKERVIQIQQTGPAATNIKPNPVEDSEVFTKSLEEKLKISDSK